MEESLNALLKFFLLLIITASISPKIDKHLTNLYGSNHIIFTSAISI